MKDRDPTGIFIGSPQRSTTAPAQPLNFKLVREPSGRQNAFSQQAPPLSRNRENGRLLSQQLMDERNRDRSFADRRRYAFDIACANIARGKNTGQAGFEQVGPATERPVCACQLF